MKNIVIIWNIMISIIKKTKLGKFLTKSKLVLNFYRESLNFFFLLTKYNASIDTYSNKQKLQYALLKENHVIEKGMSLRSPKKGFGKERVLKLLNDLIEYYHLYKDDDFIKYPLATIKTYIRYSKGNKVAVDEIENKFDRLRKLSNLVESDFKIDAGVKEVTKDEILQKSKIDFENLVKTRHSIRYLSPEPPEIDLINAALAIAQRTPSACNRQAWFTYIFNPQQTFEVLSWQGGARGFEKDIPMAILVTANLNAFLSHEPHQAYVDGGMYAMSLIYALHAQGLGTVPLSTAFKVDKIKKLHKKFGIPQNEVPIVIVGVGQLLNKFNVAISIRKPIEETTNYRIEKLKTEESIQFSENHKSQK